MSKLLTLLLISLFNNTISFKIKPIINKNFPKISYTKIHDISYRSSNYIGRKRPYTFYAIKQLNKTISNYINNCVNNYIDEVYCMASFPLSFVFVRKSNNTNQSYYKRDRSKKSLRF